MSAPALSSYAARLPAEGSFSLWAGPLDGPAVVEHRVDAQHYAASTMKVSLVLAAYRRADAGTLDLDGLVPVRDEFGSRIGGRFSMDRDDDSDDEPWRRLGTDVSLRWLACRAIVRSSNLATNLLLDAVGLPAVEEALAAVGARHTVIARGIEDLAARDAGIDNLVTAADLARTLGALATGRAASPASCVEIVSFLAAQQINDAIPAGLPPGVRVAHKGGWVTGITHDAAIVCPADSAAYILVVCTTSALDDEAALTLIRGAAEASWSDREILA